MRGEIMRKILLSAALLTASVAHAQTTSYTLADVAKHATATDCWMVLNSTKVYNFTPFVSMHPGGSTMVPYCGKNGDPGFASVPHSSNAVALETTYLIGALVAAPAPISVTISPTNANNQRQRIVHRCRRGARHRDRSVDAGSDQVGKCVDHRHCSHSTAPSRDYGIGESVCPVVDYRRDASIQCDSDQFNTRREVDSDASDWKNQRDRCAHCSHGPRIREGNGHVHPGSDEVRLCAGDIDRSDACAAADDLPAAQS